MLKAKIKRCNNVFVFSLSQLLVLGAPVSGNYGLGVWIQKGIARSIPISHRVPLYMSIFLKLPILLYKSAFPRASNTDPRLRCYLLIMEKIK